MVSLENSHYFHGHNTAWETINKLKQQEIPDCLKEFLENSLPQNKKVKLAVQDKNLAVKLNKLKNYKCSSGEMYTEIFRGIRTHLSKFIAGGQNEENID